MSIRPSQLTFLQDLITHVIGDFCKLKDRCWI